MGLLDILNGMQGGPRGQTDPNAKGRMSPITMAILALLAYKGIKQISGGQQAPQLPGGNNNIGASASGGGLGDILGGLLGGGSSGGGPGGGALSGGLGGLANGGPGGAPPGGRGGQ